MIEKVPVLAESAGGKEKKEKSVEELRAELMATGKVAEFVDAELYEPAPIPDEVSQLTRAGVEVADEYLRRPMVIDKGDAFGGHRERRKWRANLPLDTREVYENNSLRRNLAGSALSAADYAVHDIRETEHGKKLKEERDALLAEFEQGFKVSEENPDGVWSTDEKIEFINKKLKPFLLKVRTVVTTK